jgi:hypothetical protein
MLTEFTILSDSHHQQRELAIALERRRVAAERAVAAHGGDRLALIAHLARQARLARGTSAPRPLAGS